MKNNKVSKMLSLILGLFLALSIFVPSYAQADWPTKPITIVVAYTAGGTADTANRTLAKEMSEYLKQDFSIINVTGGSGSIAGLQVFNAPSDGYTLLGAVAHSTSAWRLLDYADIGWEDFYGFHAATAPYILFVDNDSKFDTAEDLFEAIKSTSNMKWGHAGMGSINHLTGEQMLKTLGLEALALPYGGGRDAATKVMAGEVDFSWCGASDVMDLAVAGEIKVLGVCDENPMVILSKNGEYEAASLTAIYPDLKSLENLLYWGFHVKRDTPPEIVAKLRDAFEYAINTDSWKQYCETMNLKPVDMVGEADDEMRAKLESIYNWGLFDLGMGAEGKSPEDFGILRPDAFVYPPNESIKNIKPWP
jgi:tripartite-type tricarboxylate transporter receptor subunit TctC